MFKFIDVKNDLDKEDKIKRMQSAFGNLKSKIDIIKSYIIGVNSKQTDFSNDLVITSEYDTWDDLDYYLKHPEHQNAINLCKDIKKEKAVVDYEF
jgi:hypothetical protein